MKFSVPLLIVASSISFFGCGKKKESTAKIDKSAKKVAFSKKNEIPLYDFDGQELFDNSDEHAFAFVDGNSKKIAPMNATDENEPLALSWNDDKEAGSDFKAVVFNFNKYDIRADQRPVVEKDVDLAKNAVTLGKRVIVQGHADKFGSASYNLVLSEQRAKALKVEMTKKGLDEDRIEIVGFGQELPLVWSDATDRLQQIKELEPNRRAEVVIEG